MKRKAHVWALAILSTLCVLAGLGSPAAQAATALNLKDVTIANGRYITAPTVAGAGILNAGTLTVSDSVFSGNDAGGGCCFGLDGGAIANSGGTVTVSRSTFSANGAGGSGGGIYSAGGTLTVAGSVFSGNHTNNWGGGIFNGSGSTLTVTDTTFSGNTDVYSG